jgi:hypothetical protein
VGEAVDVARAEDEGAAELEGIAAEFVLMVAGGLGTFATLEIVAAKEVEEVGFAEVGELVGLAVGVDEEGKVDAGFFLEEASVAGVAKADGGEGGIFGAERLLVFAQLRDVLAAEDSTVVAEEYEDSGMRFPERAETDLVTEGVGEGDAGETLAEGVGHGGMIEEAGQGVKLATIPAVGREKPALEGPRRGGILQVG